MGLHRRGPAICFLAILLAGCDRPETGREPAAVELNHVASIVAEGGYIDVFGIALVRESAAWADVNVTLDGVPHDLDRRDLDGDGRVSVGDEVGVEVADDGRNHVVAIETAGRVLGASMFTPGDMLGG